ncbi:hypothetical protein HXX01_04315 [Candidatus Nomurabacteria bacterium]|nr:hypothetical protein [Candidatus Nomurabacteria bacterium]
MESILTPYGAFIIHDKGKLFITDLNSMLGSDTDDYNIYNINTFSYINYEALTLNQGSMNLNIGYFPSNQTFDYINPYNEQVVKFSPYNIDNLINYEASSDFTGYTGTYNYSTFTEDNYSTSNYWQKISGTTYFIRCNTNNTIKSYLKFTPAIYNGYSSWGNAGYWFDSIIFNSGAVVAYNDDLYYSLQSDNQNHQPDISPTYWELIIVNSNEEKMRYKASIHHIIKNNKYYLKVNGEAYIRTFNNSFDPNGAFITYLIIYLDIRCGSKKLTMIDNFTPYWKDISLCDNTLNELNFYPLYFTKGLDENIVDEWIEISNGNEQFYQNISLNDLTSNNVTISIYDFRVIGKNEPNDLVQLLYIKDVRLSKLALQIFDQFGNELNSNDIEYTGYMDKNVKDNGPNLTLLLGTNVNSYPLAKGSLLYLSGSTFDNMTTWTRQGKTDIIENLLLNSIESNYKTQSIQLSVTLNKLYDLTDNHIYCNIGKYYNTWFPDVKFMVAGLTHNFTNSSTEIVFIEARKDELNIIKNY